MGHDSGSVETGRCEISFIFFNAMPASGATVTAGARSATNKSALLNKRTEMYSISTILEESVHGILKSFEISLIKYKY